MRSYNEIYFRIQFLFSLKRYNSTLCSLICLLACCRTLCVHRMRVCEWTIFSLSRHTVDRVRSFRFLRSFAHQTRQNGGQAKNREYFRETHFNPISFGVCVLCEANAFLTHSSGPSECFRLKNNANLFGHWLNSCDLFSSLIFYTFFEFLCENVFRLEFGRQFNSTIWTLSQFSQC